jgi:starch phosphorylase
MQANPELSSLISEAIGAKWVRDLDELRALEAFSNDVGFQRRWMEVTRAKKQQLGNWAKGSLATHLDPDTLFDVQVKRIHEYKRQLLNILHVISLYHRLVDGTVSQPQPRTFLFAGKAAPAYAMAKRIIRLIAEVGAVIHADPNTKGLLQVMFLPNYNVSLAERVMPAADVSEQISTAGLEASGTGNMKLSLNGALTVGTLDGANVEIREAVGAENFFLFGLTTPQVADAKQKGYRPGEYYEKNAILRRVLDSLIHGEFSGGSTELFRPVVRSLLDGGDPFMVLADFESYRLCQEAVAAVYQQPAEWARRSILNVARMGPFSSDKTIANYARDIWAVPVNGAGGNGQGD